MPEHRNKRKSHPLRIAFRWFRVVVLLFFAVAQSLSIAMDVVRLVLWGPFILSNILQVSRRKNWQRRASPSARAT